MGALTGSREPRPSGLGPSGFDPERLDEIVRQSSLIKKAAIELGMRYPEEIALDAIYVLASGINNRSRRIVARQNDSERRAAARERLALEVGKPRYVRDILDGKWDDTPALKHIEGELWLQRSEEHAAASAIEARRAATGNTDAVHESAVAESETPR